MNGHLSARRAPFWPGGGFRARPTSVFRQSGAPPDETALNPGRGHSWGVGKALTCAKNSSWCRSAVQPDPIGKVSGPMIDRFVSVIIAVVVIGLIALVSSMRCRLTPSPKKRPLLPTPMRKNWPREQSASSGQLRPRETWDHIEVYEKTTARDYQLTLYYRLPPPNYTEAEFDTKRIARAVLTELVEAGAKPSDERISVYVAAYRRVKGETGKDMIEGWGFTRYDSNHDELVYSHDYGPFGR